MSLKDLDIFLEGVNGNKLEKVVLWYEPDQSEELYIAHDGRGNFALANDGSIFLGSKEDMQTFDIDGKPHAKDKKKEAWLYEYDGKFGIYDINMKLIDGPFDSMEDFLKEFNDRLQRSKDETYDPDMDLKDLLGLEYNLDFDFGNELDY